MNRERQMQAQHKSECASSECRYFPRKCISLCGSDCTKLGGSKIPVHRMFEAIESFPAQKTHGMASYWITDGHMMSEGRE
jgi:hypothetical protein